MNERKIFKRFYAVIPKDRVTVDFLYKLMHSSVISSYAFVLHDKDLNREPHFHFVFSVHELCSVRAVAEFLGIWVYWVSGISSDSSYKESIEYLGNCVKSCGIE